MFWKKKDKDFTEGLTWFNYAVMLPDIDEDEKELTVIGSFNIKNTGTSLLKNPIICIRIKPSHDVRLGGKIGSATHTALTIDGTNTEAWHYIDDNWKEKTLETGEHWLKPNQCKQLEPGKTLAFSTEIRILTTKREGYVIIEGFFYCDEINNGFPALNTITINF